MVNSITGSTMELGDGAPIVLRGDYPTIIKQAKNLGYDAIELHIHDSSVVDKEEIKRNLEENGITLSSIGTGSAYGKDHLSLSSPDKAVREKAVARLVDHMKLAQEFNAVVIIGLLKGLIKECPSREEFDKNLSESLHTLIEVGKELDVVLVFEILNRYESDVLNTIDEGIAFIDTFDSPYLRLHIDTYHMNIEETQTGEAIKRAKGKIAHCHIADSDRWYAGHGHYDFKDTIEALQDINYDGALAVESLYFPESLASGKESLEILKKYNK